MCVKTEKFEPLFLTKNDVDNKLKDFLSFQSQKIFCHLIEVTKAQFV